MHIKALWYKTNLHSLKAMQRLDRLLKFNKSKAAQFRFKVLISIVNTVPLKPLRLTVYPNQRYIAGKRL